MLQFILQRSPWRQPKARLSLVVCFCIASSFPGICPLHSYAFFLKALFYKSLSKNPIPGSVSMELSTDRAVGGVGLCFIHLCVKRTESGDML